MKKINLLLIFIWSVLTISAQETLNNSEYTFKEVQEYESNLGSVLAHTYPYEEGQTRTFIFDRENDRFILRLHAWYTFDEDLNELIEIEYNWGLYNPGFNADKNLDLLQKLVKKEKKFRRKFKKVHKDLQKKYGPETNNEIMWDGPLSFGQTITWDLDDKKITLHITFTRQLKEIPEIGWAANFFRISQEIEFK